MASFFVSRIDSLVDTLIDERIKKAQAVDEGHWLTRLQGKVAIANAKLAYQSYKQIFGGARWQALAKRGAQTQRVLWASTGTKNPAFSDVLYIEELIGPDTVNTIPPATLRRLTAITVTRAPALEKDVEGARQTMAALAKAGISMKEVTDKLTDDGVKLFEEAFDKLLDAVDKRAKKGAPSGAKNFTYQAARRSRQGSESRTRRLEEERQSEAPLGARCFALDQHRRKQMAGLAGHHGRPDRQSGDRSSVLPKKSSSGRFTESLLLGMGGSSLCVEVLELTFGQFAAIPKCTCSIPPIPRRFAPSNRKIDLGKSLFIVSSKSGSTLEPNIFKQYFFERVKQTVGEAEAGKRFIAITDPGSKMQQVAERDGFRHIFFGLPTIGGRYSALSNFGVVPAAVQGIDLPKFLDSAEEMVHACASVVPADQNPGVILGAILGTLHNRGRDKVTIFTSPGISDLGAWLEQLIAESTGKEGKGLIPVDREQIGAPEVYGSDRIFAYLRLAPAPDAKQDAAVDALEKAGHPVVRIAVAGHLRGRPGIFPLGNRHRRGRLHHGHQPVQSARRGSQQNRNAQAHRRIREERFAAGRIAGAAKKAGSSCSPTQRTPPRSSSAGRGRHARRLPARASRTHPARRLFRRARLHPEEQCA